MDDVLEATIVLENGWASADDVRRANAACYRSRPQLGKLAMTRGKLTVPQVFEILGQKAITGDLFGETAMQLGLLRKGDLYDLLQLQANLTPTLTESLLALDMITTEQADVLARRSQFEQLESRETTVVELPC